MRKLGKFKPVISVMVDSAQCTFLEVLGTLWSSHAEYSRLSQVAKAADGARDGRVPPVAVETQRTRSWLVADDDNSVYFLLN